MSDEPNEREYAQVAVDASVPAGIPIGFHEAAARIRPVANPTIPITSLTRQQIDAAIEQDSHAVLLFPTDLLTIEQRNLRRLLVNRESARKCRNRRKNHLVTLQAAAREMTEKNKALKVEKDELLVELQYLRRECKRKREREGRGRDERKELDRVHSVGTKKARPSVNPDGTDGPNRCGTVSVKCPPSSPDDTASEDDDDDDDDDDYPKDSKLPALPASLLSRDRFANKTTDTGPKPGPPLRLLSHCRAAPLTLPPNRITPVSHTPLRHDNPLIIDTLGRYPGLTGSAITASNVARSPQLYERPRNVPLPRNDGPPSFLSLLSSWSSSLRPSSMSAIGCDSLLASLLSSPNTPVRANAALSVGQPSMFNPSVSHQHRQQQQQQPLQTDIFLGATMAQNDTTQSGLYLPARQAPM